MRVNFPLGKIPGFLFATFPKIEMSSTSRWKISKRFYGQNSFLRKCPKERERQMKVGFRIWFSKKHSIHISVSFFFVSVFPPWFCYWRMMLAILNFFTDVTFTDKNRFFSRERGGSMKVKVQGKTKVTTAYWRFRSALPGSSMANRIMNDIVTRNITR